MVTKYVSIMENPVNILHHFDFISMGVDKKWYLHNKVLDDTMVLVVDQGHMNDKVMAYLQDGVKETGKFEPNEVLNACSEHFNRDEYDEAYSFLAWCHRTGMKFGHNIGEIYEQFKRENNV